VLQRRITQWWVVGTVSRYFKIPRESGGCGTIFLFHSNTVSAWPPTDCHEHRHSTRASTTSEAVACNFDLQPPLKFVPSTAVIQKSN
jgi:hypothetical protein